MFIAVNANKPPSPFGGADGQVVIYPSSQSPLLPNGEGRACRYEPINISPRRGEDKDDICSNSRFELLDCCSTTEPGAMAGSTVRAPTG